MTELVEWYHLLQSVLSKEIRVKKYITRVKEQNMRMSNVSKDNKYQKVIDDIREKLTEIGQLQSLKKKYEKEHNKDEQSLDYMDTIVANSKIQDTAVSILSTLLGQNLASQLLKQKNRESNQAPNSVGGTNSSMMYNKKKTGGMHDEDF